MDRFEFVFFCVLFALVALTLYGAINYKKAEAEAEPVTAEIPVYVAKCTEQEFTLNTCIEFTIYRITRN